MGADGRGDATEAKTNSVDNELAPTLTHLPTPDTDEGKLDETLAQGASDTSPGIVRGGDVRHAKLFGDYAIEGEIARGGMGVVFKAKQVSLNRPVALKLILASNLAGDDEVRRFYAEAESAAKLDHPGIVPVYEVGQIDSQHFFSMGFVEGGSLLDLMADGPLDGRRAAQLVKSIAEAVQYAHTRNIVHRDLKPGNVLLDIQGQGVKLAKPEFSFLDNLASRPFELGTCS